MAITHSPDAAPAPSMPHIHTITTADLKASLRDGWADFMERRGDLILLGLLYPLVGFFTIVASRNGFHIDLLFPLFAGLTLLGPLVATGFYELAKRREEGRDAGWNHFLDVTGRPSFPSIAAIGALLFLIFSLWILVAAGIYTAFLGLAPNSIAAMVTTVLTTSAGWQMMLVGNLVGFAFAVIVLAISTVSLPMLVDRNISGGDAIATSIAAFRANPGMMLRWGFTVAVLLILGAIPLLIGLAVVLPVLGYATWHLYTRLVEREGAAPTV
ncbi:DUF2189 domain-containing protein [Stakelama sediminis]|uniref:Putative membrane protein n=1 Tax=Stakelama sediminis TaxID=463200 RepID=A0A840YUT3_9SPHN|nr:DUF2189 domain-containing protein [Stakelama sediminis]MBB5717330.1 putative membrane protein [Stakelama sediminis]